MSESSVLIRKLVCTKYLADWMKQVKATRKQTRRAMYFTERVDWLVSPKITAVMNTLELLPIHAPMSELRAMESEARLFDADMLLDITWRARPVWSGLICERWGFQWKLDKEMKEYAERGDPVMTCNIRSTHARLLWFS